MGADVEHCSACFDCGDLIGSHLFCGLNSVSHADTAILGREYLRGIHLTVCRSHGSGHCRLPFEEMKAVLFDMDGVLVNSEWLNNKACTLSLKEQGISLTKKDKKVITGRHPADFMPLLRKKYQFNLKKAIDRHLVHYGKEYSQVKLYPGAKQLLMHLKKRCKLALVTGSPRVIVKRALINFDIDVFDAIVPFESCQKRKPAPDVYVLAAKKLKVKKSECTVIEDSVPGVQAAKNAGMKCLAVLTTNPASKLKKADIRVRSLKSKSVRKFLKC